MNISVNTISLDSPANVPVSPISKETHTLPRELLAELHAGLSQATADATEKAFRYADTMSRTMLDRMGVMVEEATGKMEKLKQASALCQHIKFNTDPAVKLSKPMHPELTNMVKVALPDHAGRRDNIMLIGPAGCGKTTLAEQLSEALKLPFAAQTFTDGASETWVLGRWTSKGDYILAQFIDRFSNGGVYLADEFDACGANLAMLFNTAIENGKFTNPMNGETIVRHPDFIFVAACNTTGRGGDMVYTARNRLDASTLRRFCKFTLDYVESIDKACCPDDDLRNWLIAGRNRLRDIKSKEFISSGCLYRAYSLALKGFNREYILTSLATGWSKETLEASRLVNTMGKSKDTTGVPF